MHYIKLTTGFLFLFGLAIHHGPAYSAAPCKGPNKNDPGCGDTGTAAVVPVVVDNATVDWFNQKIVVRGSGLSGATEFILGGSSALSSTPPVDDTVVELDFDTILASEVDLAGNYVLKVDGTNVLSLFFESEVVDPEALGCPCDLPWPAALNPLDPSLWAPSPKTTQCVEIPGPTNNDLADIAGTILTDPNNPTVYPQYPIGAAFVPGDPVSSVCRLVQVEDDGSQSDLVNLRINELQQTACATTLQTNVCTDP